MDVRLGNTAKTAVSKYSPNGHMQGTKHLKVHVLPTLNHFDVFHQIIYS